VLDNKRGAVQYRLNIYVKNKKIIAEMIRAKILLLSTFCLFSLCFCALSVLGKEDTKEKGVIPYKEWEDYTSDEKEGLRSRWTEDDKYKIIPEIIIKTKSIPEDALKIKGSDGEERYDLRGNPLYGADLKKANLAGANLQGANLAAAKLQGANFVGAKLQGANFTGAKLQGAALWLSDLKGANLTVADLQGADLTVADLQGEPTSREPSFKEPASWESILKKPTSGKPILKEPIYLAQNLYQHFYGLLI